MVDIRRTGQNKKQVCLTYNSEQITLFHVNTRLSSKCVLSFFVSFFHLPPRPCIIFIPRPIPMPRPRPLPAGGWEVPFKRPAASACCCSLFGLRIVWSTERIVTAASVAAVNTLTLTISGSQTNNSIKSVTLPPRTLTPYQRPFSPSMV